MFCWLYKFMISHTADGDTQPSRIIQKHIRRCTSCRRFHQTCQSLAEGLRREAAISKDSIVEGLTGRMLMAISHRRKETHKVRPKLWIKATAACLALIFLIGALLLFVKRNAREISQPDRMQIALAIRELRAVYEQVGKDIPKTWPAVIEQPLTTELKNLTNDTQSAVRFLVACVAVDIDSTKNRSLN
jgi:hypothetical protein